MEEKPEVPRRRSPISPRRCARAGRERRARAGDCGAARNRDGRLALLESELKPVVRQAPPGVDLFDLTLSSGERPRLFLDMVAFVEMGRDRRTYRYFQDTLHGRVLIAEGQQIERIVAAITNYVARRLVERERALAAEGRRRAQPAGLADAAGRARAAPPAPADVRAGAGNAFAFLLMTLGSVTLICLLALGGYLAWTLRLRAIWAHWFGLPPF